MQAQEGVQQVLHVVFVLNAKWLSIALPFLKPFHERGKTAA
jgi:hypothetical protein